MPLSRSFGVMRTKQVLALLSMILALIIAQGLSNPAQALLRVCNQTDETVSLAIGYRENNLTTSEGWWTLLPQSCETVIAGDLSHEQYYLYAIDKQDGEWGGASRLCIDVLKFIISGVDTCKDQGFQSAGFFALERNNLPSQVVNLTRAPTAHSIE